MLVLFPLLMVRGTDHGNSFQKHRMESLIRSMEAKEFIIGFGQPPKEISEWSGLTFNEAQEITEISWVYSGLRGQINLKEIPPSVAVLLANGNTLDGSVNLTYLSTTLIVLNLSRNCFSGPITLTKLPPDMEVLSMSVNKLDGSLELQSLPPSLRELILYSNFFSGTVSLAYLPPRFEVLEICDNRLSGPIDVSALPQGMKVLLLQDNHFEGSTDFRHLSQSVHTLNVSNTCIEGTISAVREKDVTAQKSKVIVETRVANEMNDQNEL